MISCEQAELCSVPREVCRDSSSFVRWRQETAAGRSPLERKRTKAAGDLARVRAYPSTSPKRRAKALGKRRSLDGTRAEFADDQTHLVDKEASIIQERVSPTRR